MNEIVKTESEFELNAEIVAGKLTSNAKELAAKIKDELKNYTVERYINNPDEAKKDKAFLTKVKTTIADKRKEISAKWNEPLNSFLDEMKSLESAVTESYNGLNGIVQQAANAEKENKRKEIENYWKTLGITIITLDQIFNQKWLNKTFKMSDIMLEVESQVERIQSELGTIKSMQSEDSEILQAFYLETLDLNATLTKGNELKANRAKIKAEETKKSVEVVKEAFQGEIVQKPEENLQNSAKIAEISPKTEEIQQKTVNKADEIMEFTLKFRGTRKALWDMKNFMLANKIEYVKL